jgi:hypothetical protein
MRFCRTSTYDALPQNLFYYTRWRTGAVHSKVGLLIRGEALGMQGSKTGLIAKQRPSGHDHTPGQEGIDGSVKPEDWRAGSAEEIGAAGLGVSTASQGENSAFPLFRGAAECGAQLICFDLAKGRLAQALEYFGNGEVRCFFNAGIQIDEAPSQLTGQQGSDGGLAGAHEACKA